MLGPLRGTFKIFVPFSNFGVPRLPRAHALRPKHTLIKQLTESNHYTLSAIYHQRQNNNRSIAILVSTRPTEKYRFRSSWKL